MSSESAFLYLALRAYVRSRPCLYMSRLQTTAELDEGLENTYKSNFKLEKAKKDKNQQQHKQRGHYDNVSAAHMREEVEDVERWIWDVEVWEDGEGFGEQGGRQLVREEVAGGVVGDGG